ncbi:HlyD family secretion protein [Enterovibrio norvegicus]|uniref:HlyD family secretion protein n=1 Tax=Enterovibrio norvegicus TaxID=188144 RepID=UPI00354F8285
MDILLIMTYTALCIVVFKVFHIPLTKWTVPTAVLGGIGLVGSLILLMNYNHPYTQFGGNVFVTTPIIPNVRGQVVDVPVKPNQLLKEGDVLFQLDTTLFDARLLDAKAALQSAKQSSLELNATYETAKANTVKAVADRDRTKKEYARYEAGAKKGAFTAASVDNRRQLYLAAEATLKAVQSQEEKARFAAQSEIDGQNTIVAQAQAQLDRAQFDLDSATVRAPSDGYVTQVTLRPGMLAVPMPLRPVMTFIPKETELFVGAFRQNSLLRLEPGFNAEFIFKAIPGRVFQGEIVEVLPAIGESQVQAQGTLYGSQLLDKQGRALVTLKINEDMSQYSLPDGTNAEIAVYSDSIEHLAIMRKVLLRMKSWQNYLYLDH